MKNIEDIYELSPMQQGMLFHTLYAPTSGIYLNQLTCTVKGNLDIDIFKESWQNCINRHTILRTSFHWENLDKPMQVVNRQVELSWTYHDWRNMSAHAQQGQYEKFLAEDRRKGFQLNRAPLIRCSLIRCDHDNFRFIWTQHHILMDGWCFQLLVEEVLNIYKALKLGTKINLPHARPYRDFIKWHQAHEIQQQEAKKYWQNELQGFSTVTNLIHSQIGKPHANKESSVHHYLELPEALSTRLETQARMWSVTLNILVQGAWSLLLSQYNATKDIIYGITVSGRPPEIEGIETMIGLFINTIPLRAQVEPEKLLISWLQEFQLKQAERETYSYCSLVDIQTWSQIPHGTPLFDTLLIYENYPLDQTRANGIDGIRFIDTNAFEQSNYPLVIIFLPGKNFTIKYHYDPGVIETPIIHRLSEHLQVILKKIAWEPDLPLNHYTPLTEEEKHVLLNQWNNTGRPYNDRKCIHEIFDLCQGRHPYQTALIYHNQVLTYRELNLRANQLAHYLHEIGVGPDVIVGLEIKRSLEMIIGIMGILKAGGAYLPLDPSLPIKRLRFMMDDARSCIVVTGEHSNILSSLYLDTTCSYRTVNISSLMKTFPLESQIKLNSPALPSHLAYVIFTSGTTGKPKGVLLNHHGVCNFIEPKAEAFNILEGDRILQFASLNFDASVSEIFAALLNGAILVLDDQDNLSNPAQLWEILKMQRVNIIKMPPVILRLLPNHDLPELKTVISAGEKCSQEIAEKWEPGRRFLNAYGPTETTVINTIHINNLKFNHPLIGKPLANTRVYILDAKFLPVPIMVPGELFISGIGLARGYLNRPELTHEKFIPNPYCKNITGQEGQNIYRYMYRTGDIVCWHPCGEIDFLGRSDHQIKIRGFRIEPGEIEAQLVLHPAVKQAAVVVIKEQQPEPRLAAYVVLDTGEKSISESQLRLYLSQRLPHYMVPSFIKIIDTLPLTNSRKIDRQELAKFPLNSQDIAREKEFIPPRDAIEFKLCQIWEDILRVQPVGIRDNFFTLGGHSFLAMRILSRLSQTFGRSMSLRQLLEEPTIEGVAGQLQKKNLPPEENLLVRFTPSTSPTPSTEDRINQPVLFCIHPSAASVICYKTLAHSLGNQQPCCGIEDPGLLGLAPQQSIEEMARQNITTMKQHQLIGPYYLLGWSFGGIVAFEMACQLKKQGDSVALLSLLDTPPPNIRENLAPGWESVEIFSFAHRLERTFGQEIHLCRNLSPEKCRELPPERVIELIMETAQFNKQIQDPQDLQHLLRWLTVFKTNCRAASVYNPQPYPGKIVFFYAEESHAAGSEIDCNQWKQWAREGIEFHSIPGNHFTMLEIPQVHSLARELQCYLVNNQLTLTK